MGSFEPTNRRILLRSSSRFFFASGGKNTKVRHHDRARLFISGGYEDRTHCAPLTLTSNVGRVCG